MIEKTALGPWTTRLQFGYCPPLRPWGHVLLFQNLSFLVYNRDDPWQHLKYVTADLHRRTDREREVSPSGPHECARLHVHPGDKHSLHRGLVRVPGSTEMPSVGQRVESLPPAFSCRCCLCFPLGQRTFHPSALQLLCRAERPGPRDACRL